MAIGTYELWLDHWYGTRLAYLDSMLELEYTRVLHGVGVINLTMPSSFDIALLQHDYKIEVWRALPKVSKRLENVYLIRGWRQWTDSTGVNRLTIMGVDGNSILQRRIVWAQPGTAEAEKDDYAGNVVKELVTESMADIFYAPSNRDTLATYVSVQGNNNDGASFKKDYAWLRLYDAVQSCIDTSASEERGNKVLWWYMVPLSGAKYEFRVKETLWGQDLTDTVILSPGVGMSEVEYLVDYSETFNVVVTTGGAWGGLSFPDWLFVKRAYDKIGQMSTPFSYSEMVESIGESRDYAELQAEAESLVKADENRPQESLIFALEQIDALRYGRDWDLGDKVGVSYQGKQREAVIKSIYLETGNTEKIRVYFKIDIEQDIIT